MLDARTFGRFAEPARLVLAVLLDGPRGVVSLLDGVRSLDGPIGPGTLYAAIARLERSGLIHPANGDDGRRAYRLTRGMS
jgi:DNA-binding PadR family transcriptional regulator